MPFGPRSPTWWGAALLPPMIATGLGAALGASRTAAAALVYLVGVLVATIMAGRAAGISAAVLSFVGLNVGFTPPRGTFKVAATDDLVALVVFLSVGLAVSALADRMRSERDRAQRREREATALYALTARLTSGGAEAVLADGAAAVRALLRAERCEIRIDAREGEPLVAAEGTERPGARTIEVPIRTAQRSLGALVLTGDALGEDERRVASVFAGQLATSLDRSMVEREAAAAHARAETGRLRRALVSAVSHDFRTPLAAIKMAITSLRDGGWNDQAPELLDSALEEVIRLEHLVTNMLDLARVRAGALAPERVRVTVDELIEDVLAGRASGLARVVVSLRDGLPALLADPVQIGQVLRNVIGNASRFAPEGSVITVTAAAWQEAVEIRVSDRGPGIPPDDRERVFEEFVRLGDGPGSGVGLAIARAIVGAHDGRIWIEETPGGGATVAMRLPGAGP